MVINVSEISSRPPAVKVMRELGKDMYSLKYSDCTDLFETSVVYDSTLANIWDKMPFNTRTAKVVVLKIIYGLSIHPSTIILCLNRTGSRG